MNDKFSQILKLVKEKDADCYLLPSNDEFNNEYLPYSNRRLEWLSGFTGSNGWFLLSEHSSILFTDGRYLLQARNQVVGDIVELTNQNIIQNLKKLGLKCVGIDAPLFTKDTYDKLFNLFKKNNISIKVFDEILVDHLWQGRPIQKASNIIELSYNFTGMHAKEKLKEVINNFPNDADYILITAPESICWLLNLRADDIPYNPFLLCNSLLHKSGELLLFSHESNVGKIVGGIKIKSFSELEAILARAKNNYISLDPKTCPYNIFQKVSQPILIEDPIIPIKTCKNQIEIKGFQDCHIEDAIAVCRFWQWLEHTHAVDEYQASQQLLAFRKEGKHFQYPSFASISAFKENGAIIHYQPPTQGSKKIESSGIYLIDSGGQYLNGTTDITRTIALGNTSPSKEQKLHYTLVLKGHIAISSANFPEGTTGMQLDSLARQYLWRYGLDYNHGTGHGVGHFLSVHEGPIRISKNANYLLKKDMILSNEPGLYLEGRYGIRIENLMRVVRSKHEGFLAFDDLTLVPYDKNLIDFEIMSKHELSWLKQYYERIYQELSEAIDIKLATWLQTKLRLDI